MDSVVSAKRPRKEKSRDELVLEIQKMKSIMMEYCNSTINLEEVDVGAASDDETVEIHKNLMDFKKKTEDIKSMSKDLVCKQRQAYDELTQALQRMTQIAMNYKKKASFSDEDFEHALELVEEQKAEIEELKREKKDLEAEFEQLKEIVDRSMSHSSTSRSGSSTCTYQRRCKSVASRKGDCYNEFKKRIDKLKQKLLDKEDELEDTQTSYQALIVKERSLNDELQEARKELIRGLGDECNKSILIGLKRMGELDSRSFDKVFPASLPSKGGGRRDTTEITKSVQLCSFWETNLRDQSWRPFKVIKVKGKQEEVIDEDDELLKSFKDEFGEEAYKALTTAAMELNEYNPSCREPVQEIWNFKERRRATTKEAISLVLKQLKSCKRKA